MLSTWVRLVGGRKALARIKRVGRGTTSSTCTQNYDIRVTKTRGIARMTTGALSWMHTSFLRKPGREAQQVNCPLPEGAAGTQKAVLEDRQQGWLRACGPGLKERSIRASQVFHHSQVCYKSPDQGKKADEVCCSNSRNSLKITETGYYGML